MFQTSCEDPSKQNLRSSLSQNILLSDEHLNNLKVKDDSYFITLKIHNPLSDMEMY